jgi:hypothetical protein
MFHTGDNVWLTQLEQPLADSNLADSIPRLSPNPRGSIPTDEAETEPGQYPGNEQHLSALKRGREER